MIMLMVSHLATASPPESKKRPAPDASRAGRGKVAKAQASADDTKPEQLTEINVLEGLRTGKLAASAEGTGDGKMILTLTNRTKTKLRVVLPPGLIASGATGQFGGGMGMMGGGMGGGMGGMGGGMGGMGGGMGGMGGGMGGMGGGFRSVPPTGLLETTLKPNQERHLPTSLVSLNGPDKDSQPLVPAKGEKLQISGIEQWTDDLRTRAALKRLAQAKAPQSVAQMVLWYVTAGAS
jgi:hypothetical protein